MDETYSSNVDNLNERLREYKQDQVDKASSLLTSATEKYNTQLSEYQDKWKAVQEGGQDEVTTQMGLKGVYQGAKKAYEVYKKYKGENADDSEEEDDGTEGGAEGDPQGAKLDEGNEPAPFSEEDKAFLQDPMKGMRETRQGIQSRMNDRLRQLGIGEDDSSAPSATGSAADAPADTGSGTSDADISQARATAEGADTDLGNLPEATEESAFGDLSNIPDTAWGRLDLRLRAERAIARGGNVGQGGSARGQTGASDAVTSEAPASTEGQPASGTATEGGNSGSTEQSSSGYRPEGEQSRTLDQGASSSEGGSGSIQDANPLDAKLPPVEEDLAPDLSEGGGFLGDFLTSEAATAAIPVVGEAAAFVGGLVAIGEGIAHLFHPPAKKMPTAPIAGSLVPQSVQAKYANALPSFDSSSDNIASDAVF